MKRLLLIATVIVTWRVTVTKRIDCPEVIDPWTGEPDRLVVALQEPCRKTFSKWMAKDFPDYERAVEFIETAPSTVDAIRIDGHLVGEKKK